VRGPGVPKGQTRDQLAVNVDLAPTWAALAGVKTPEFVDGRSLVPLLRNNPPDLKQWRQEFAIENGPEKDTGVVDQTPNTDPGLIEPQDQDQSEAVPLKSGKKGGLQIPHFRGVRLQEWSYVEYATGEKELYNILADPYQLQNLSGNPKFKTFEGELSARVKEMMTCKSAQCRTIEDKAFGVIPAVTALDLQASDNTAGSPQGTPEPRGRGGKKTTTP
jgi:N-acetylglucosamine-6-sulfatase